jgi:Ca2+-binding RTX toxin-like protein
MRRMRVAELLFAMALVISHASAVSAGPGTPRCFGRVATVVGTAGNDSLVGSPGPDVIVGLAGKDFVRGRGGEDRICAGFGGREDSEETLVGGAGADLLSGGSGEDYLSGGEGNDTLRGGPDDDGFDGGAGPDRLEGNGGFDVLEDNHGNDHLLGGKGKDVLHSSQGGGKDVWDGGPGIDRFGLGSYHLRHPLTANLRKGFIRGDKTGSDRVVRVEDVFVFCRPCTLIGDGKPNELEATTTVGATITGRGGNDYIYGLRGGILSGGRGDDSICCGGTISGGPGHDDLIGGIVTPSDDIMEGGSGVDLVFFGNADGGVTIDLASGTAVGDGNDTLTGIENVWGSGFGDSIVGNGSPNNIVGGKGGDQVAGGDGDDDLFGNLGNDELDGGSGSNSNDGGLGEDYCVNPDREAGALNCELP